MKKTLLILSLLLIIFFVIIFMLFMYSKNAEKSKQNIQKFNQEYEQYINKEITGTELVTLISKAINNNEKNNIPKDDKKIYIEDDAYCLKIKVKFLDSNDTYEMEVINAIGLKQFIANYNTVNFKCTQYTYNKQTGRIGQMTFEEVEEQQ